MKIKLAILEQDKNYLKRIVTSFHTKYSENLEVYSFTDYEIAVMALHDTKIDVLLAATAFDVKPEQLPNTCGFAYLVDTADIDSVNNQAAICKFQKADLIYRQILSLYSENVSNISGIKLNTDDCRMLVFAPVSGGVGASTMAASCACNYAGKGRKVLYLNLESFGSADSFFAAEGQYDMSDIVYAVKSKKANLALKMESCVRKDTKSGVCFFSNSKTALDMLELKTEEILHMISELQLSGIYDDIIVDMDFGLSERELKILQRAYAIVLVGDGSEISDRKLQRVFEAIASKEKGTELSISGRICTLYNKFSNKTGRVTQTVDWKNIGGAPRYEHATVTQIVEQLSKLQIFDEIVQE